MSIDFDAIEKRLLEIIDEIPKERMLQIMKESEEDCKRTGCENCRLRTSSLFPCNCPTWYETPAVDNSCEIIEKD